MSKIKKDFANKASMLQNASSFHACVLSIKGGRNERNARNILSRDLNFRLEKGADNGILGVG